MDYQKFSEVRKSISNLYFELIKNGQEVQAAMLEANVGGYIDRLEDEINEGK